MKAEHPFTAIDPPFEVHTNHNEAQNASLRRRAKAYRRRQNLNHLVYDSFGQIVSETNPDIEFRFGYTGREPDPETGLNYHCDRYTDPRTQTFISEDPSGFSAGDTNLYRYVENSPINLIVPSGNGPTGAAIGAGIGGIVGAGAGTLALPGEGTIGGASVGAAIGSTLEEIGRNLGDLIDTSPKPQFDPNYGRNPSQPTNIPSPNTAPQSILSNPGLPPNARQPQLPPFPNPDNPNDSPKDTNTGDSNSCPVGNFYNPYFESSTGG